MGIDNLLAYIGEIVHILLISASELEVLWQLFRAKFKRK